MPDELGSGEANARPTLRCLPEEIRKIAKYSAQAGQNVASLVRLCQSIRRQINEDRVKEGRTDLMPHTWNARDIAREFGISVAEKANDVPAFIQTLQDLRNDFDLNYSVQIGARNYFLSMVFKYMWCLNIITFKKYIIIGFDNCIHR